MARVLAIRRKRTVQIARSNGRRIIVAIRDVVVGVKPPRKTRA